MPEKLTQERDHYISDVNKIKYSAHNKAVNIAEKHIANLKDKSFKGLVKKVVREVSNLMLIRPGASQEKTESILGKPDAQLETNIAYFEQNKEAVIADAVYDANAANIDLNFDEDTESAV